ncbi:MAG: DUF362 domain-containing protein [Fusobacteriaceae bacterium]|jgi:uncharacterized protein (DUF362 family)|nr:DUF362 domain-containing protein [Fusobacteriaceae bacterium]
MSVVSIVRTKGEEEKAIAQAVREAVREAGGMSAVVKPGWTVIVKPNWVAVPPERLTGAITRWEVTKAVADLVKEAGARPIIAESSAAGVDTEKVIEKAEYTILREQGYEVIDLKKETPVLAKVPGKGKVFDEMRTWALVTKADAFISVPVLKTHDQTEVTLGMKNMKGLISDAHKKDFHRYGVIEGVVDLLTVFKPVLTVIDGTVGQEGLGPIFGNPVPMGLIIASTDIVAADAVGGKIVGYEPRDVPITVSANARGLGEMDLSKIEIRGVPIADVARRFVRACETKIEGLPPFELLFDEGTCTGCRNTVVSVLMDLKTQNLESCLKDKCIVCGPLKAERIPAGLAKEQLIVVGICAKALAEKGVFVPGCPPNNSYVVEAVVGKEIGARY